MQVGLNYSYMEKELEYIDREIIKLNGQIRTLENSRAYNRSKLIEELSEERTILQNIYNKIS